MSRKSEGKKMLDRKATWLCALGGCGIVAVGAAGLLVACNDPFGANAAIATAGPAATGSSGDLSESFNEDCPADSTWLPADGGPPPPVPMIEPAPHPDTECPFYRGAYQNFLIAGHPDSNGDPDLVHYAAIEDVFQSQYANGIVRNSGDILGAANSPDPAVNPGGAAAAAIARQGPPTGKAWLGAVRQAGNRNIAIDRNHHTLYYGLHMNQAFVNFVQQNGLDTIAGIAAVDPNLEFPPGVAEFKTAWTDIDPKDFPSGVVPPPTDLPGDPGDYSNYITTMAWIPWLTQDSATGTIEEDPDHPIYRKMALVAIHCVYTLPGHPEFIWGSVQHVNLTLVDPAPLQFAGVSILGMPDSQPNSTGAAGVPTLPDPNNPSNTGLPAPSTNNYLLYVGGTTEDKANLPVANDMDLMFNEGTQSFANPPTSVFRAYPGSKGDQLSPDTAVFSLNSNLNTLFQGAPSSDKRQNYRLVAAVWMDKPALFGLGTPDSTGKAPGLTLQNEDGTNPLVLAAQASPPDPRADISQGVTCGTPTGLDGQPGLSGDVPGATALNNTVPGCDSRYDDLDLPDAGNPQHEPEGGPIDPAADFAASRIGTDSPFSLLGGENRMSSTSMESFTQTGLFDNCFSCHNTKPINSNGVAADPTCLVANPPSSCLQTTLPNSNKINVSHMFSEFILREGDAAKRAAARADGGAGN